MNALIFVIEAVVLALARVAGDIFYHLVLIERKRAGVAVGILVVIVELTAFAATNGFSIL